MNPCISEDQLLAFARSELHPEENAHVDAHLVDCTRCQEALDRITRQALQGSPLPGLLSAEAEMPFEVEGYRLLRELGRGGMGVVWLAEQLSLKRLTALKTIRLQWGGNVEELSRRLKIEAEAIGRLAHPNIVRIFEAGLAPHGPYFTMEYIEGGSLKEKLDGVPWVPLTASRLIADLARAIHRAHEAGIVHRDLKPSNILLERTGSNAAEFIPKIGDFGLAKLLDSDAEDTLSGRLLGTPNYMSPEQAEGQLRDIGPATDVYALGALLYELLTGRPPFRGASPIDTIQLIRGSDVVSPRQLVAAIPRDLEKITLKCLEKESARRYASTVDLADDLGRFQCGEPVTARAPGLRSQWRRFARTYPVLVRTALLLALVLPFGTLAGWQAFRLGESRSMQRALETAALARQASLHAERGQWAQAVELLDRALAAGHPEPAALGIEKARSLFVLNRADVEPTLATVEHSANLDTVRAEWLLLRGDWLMGHDNAVGRTLVLEALEAGLRRTSDRLYAEGLLAPKAADARRLFQHAVDVEKFHPRANQLLVLTMLVNGDKRAARDRIELIRGAFGGDPGFRMLEAAALFVDGEAEQGKRLADSYRDLFGPDWGRRTDELLRQAEIVSQNTDAIVPDPSAYLRQIEKKGGMPFLDLKAANVPVPLFLDQADETWKAVLEAAKSPADKAKVQRLVALAGESPDGMVQFMTGLVLFGGRRLGEAEQFMLRAAELPSLINIRRPALFSAVSCQGFFLSNPKHPEIEVVRARATKSVQQLWETGAPALDWCSIFAHTSRRSGQFDIASAIVDHWAKNGGEPLELDLLRGQIQYSAGRFPLAIEKANAILDRKSDHAEAKNLLKLSSAGLDAELKRIGKRVDPLR